MSVVLHAACESLLGALGNASLVRLVSEEHVQKGLI